MAASIDTLVFTPVGPKSKPEYVLDTVESFLHYFEQSAAALLVINDTGRREIHDYLPKRANIVIYDALPKTQVPNGHNTMGNSFANQIHALRHVSRLFDWKCALRLDDDALITGPRPDLDALRVFAASDGVGMLGAYRYRGDGTNKEGAMAEKRRQLLRQIFLPRRRNDLRAARHLLKLTLMSLMNGSTPGHMCTGGAFFMSRAAYDRVSTLIGERPDMFRTVALEDDLLFSLYCSAGGFKLADFSRRDDVMAINFRGLPMPLEELVRNGKKVIHPVKDVERTEHEQEVRSFFKARRAGGGAGVEAKPARDDGA